MVAAGQDWEDDPVSQAAARAMRPAEPEPAARAAQEMEWMEDNG